MPRITWASIPPHLRAPYMWKMVNYLTSLRLSGGVPRVQSNRAYWLRKRLRIKGIPAVIPADVAEWFGVDAGKPYFFPLPGLSHSGALISLYEKLLSVEPGWHGYGTENSH